MTRQKDEMLARLLAQAQDSGADLITLRAIVEEATDKSAEHVLARLGLADTRAQGDLGELRELLRAWRGAKASAWKELSNWVVRGLLVLLLIGLTVRFGLHRLVQ